MMILGRLGPLQKAVDSALAEMKDDRVMRRIWAHDHTVWKPEPTEISNRLGWLHAAELMTGNLHRLQTVARAVRDDGYTHALLLGMGGSSLAPEVLRNTLGVSEGYLDLAVLDSTDPGAVLSHAETLDLSKTLFILSSKSGTTVESLSLFKFFYGRVVQAFGADRAGAHFIAITDPGSKLTKIVAERSFRATFLNDPDIGGRYSALSFFGLAPAALMGIDAELLLERAREMACNCGGADCPHEGEDIGAQLGAVMGEVAKAGRDKLTLVASPSLESFGDWVEQLVAESTGKEGRGMLPVVGEPLGSPASYGSDRLFVQLKTAAEEAHDAVLEELEKAGHPVVRLILSDLYDLGGQFFLWEMATAVAGHRLGVNPFDQPDVDAAKALARRMLAEYQRSGALPEDQAADLGPEALKHFLLQARPGDYIALQAYVNPTPEVSAVLGALRATLRDQCKLATAVGYGPRYLHSTGQLHKGDGGNGLFIQFTADAPSDLPIPDEAGSQESSVSFGVLERAQALGDRLALLEAGRRLIHFHLGEDPIAGLKQMAEALE